MAVRALLQDYKAENMPTRSMRSLWIGIAETMLKLDQEAATAAEVTDLLRQFESLRRAVRAHEANIGS